MKAKLSMAFQDLRGKDGTCVIVMTRNGLALRADQNPSNPKTAAQTDVRENFSKASTTFRGLTSGQGAAWDTYAGGITRTDPITGKSYNPTAIDVFVGLASKFLQVNPTGTIPVTPPTSSFAGDSITFTVTPGTGVINITASGVNASGVTTEFLIQPLASVHRKPQWRAYRHAAFKVFAVGQLSLAINVPAGYYAVAYRFVKTATGQMTDPVQLPIQSVALSLAPGGAAEEEAAAPASKKKAA